MRRLILAATVTLPLICLAASLPGAASGAERPAPTGREVRCLAMIAYAEAAVDGVEGMAAVIRVVRNRMADSRFPGDACAVIAQAGQFQPVTQSAALRQVARDPDGYSIPQVLGVRSPGARRLLATAHRLARAPRPGPDPTGAALYFVNPAFMDPANCPWFADLRRTARIGSHVFMTDRGVVAGAEPALDCAEAGPGRAGAGAVPDS